MAQLTDDCFAFSGPLLPIADAERMIRERVAPVVEVVTLPLNAARGRVLAHDLLAPSDLPPFDNSAVDGYAVRHADLDPVAESRFTIVERLTAGRDQQDPAVADAKRAQLEARAGHDVWDRLGAITCPTLIGYGNYDGIAPARNSTAIASRIPGAELRGYDGGHLFLFQDPAALPEFEAFLQAPSS